MIELVKTFQILQAVGHDKFDPYAYQPAVPFVFINFYFYLLCQANQFLWNGIGLLAQKKVNRSVYQLLRQIFCSTISIFLF